MIIVLPLSNIWDTPVSDRFMFLELCCTLIEEYKGSFDKKKRKRERMKEREREKLLKICGNYGNIYKMSWPTFPFTDKFANQLEPLRNQPYSSSFHINHQAYPF